MTHEIARAYVEQAVAWRRYLHQYPELSFEEVETSRYILGEMTKLKHVTRIEKLTETSLVVVFDSGKPGPKIGLRADIDGLPVTEDRDDLPFASKVEGKMHACGHDGHSAILMAACQYLDDHFDELEGEVHAIFQHAEELPPGGAREMVATGYFDDFDFIYGQHLMSFVPLGKIDIKAGPGTANSDIYSIKIIGKGGHAAMPEETIDPVVIGAQFVTNLQSIVARQCNPLDAMVISNTVFHAGTADNVIPHSVTLRGSVRTHTKQARNLADSGLEKLLKGLCEANGASYEYEFQYGYDAVQNDPEKTAIVRDLARKRYGEHVISEKPMMGGEDFSAFSLRVPSTFGMIGAKNPEKGFDYPHHHPKFGIDEDSFEMGIQMMVDVALNSRQFAGR
ncbi:M20 metallopeptidase family protein [Leisingera caerulea]|uniref:M20 metallopeptidase family protein n=1 Tax=Leisingera caerulea TaxID=506591 RepID=UPI0003FC8062|nr:amidohydrolase [Leisingera caerulea]